jgi:hypothetical protein
MSHNEIEEVVGYCLGEFLRRHAAVLTLREEGVWVRASNFVQMLGS